MSEDWRQAPETRKAWAASQEARRVDGNAAVGQVDNTPLDSHQLAKRYAKARDMTLKEFANYCVKLYMDTTPLDPDAEPDLEYDGR